MKRRILTAILVSVFLTTACSKEAPETMNVLPEAGKGSYSYVIPFQATNTRNYHSTYQTEASIYEIGAGMERHSLNYFSPKEYYAREGSVITRSILSDLVGRESDSNPQGLNPEKGSSFAISDSRSIVDAVVVTDVFELDFVKANDMSYETAGMCIAIVVNPEQTENGSVYMIREDRLWDYATNAGRKLESYLRTLKEVQNIPILITIYSSASADEILPGGFLGYAYFSGRSGQFSRIEDSWVLIPTSQAQEKDAEIYNQFLRMKEALKDYLPENIVIMGRAQYENEEAVYLHIRVGVQAKTYVESKSLTQYCAQLLREFTSSNLRIVVEIQSNENIFALIERKVNESVPEVIYVY